MLRLDPTEMESTMETAEPILAKLRIDSELPK
jgi:hypothetical protein